MLTADSPWSLADLRGLAESLVLPQESLPHFLGLALVLVSL